MLQLVLPFLLAAAAPDTATATTAATATAAAAPQIELITMGAGHYLYSYWGHSALRVIDHSAGTDVAYNFGGVDIDEGFFMRMMRGYVEAYVFQKPWAEVLRQYSGEDRDIVRRPLDMKPESARAVAEGLAELTRDGKSYYAYHHFYDNCSTQLADALDRAMGGMLKVQLQQPARGTYRSRVLEPAEPHTLIYVLLDLSYSGVVDQPLTAWQTGFLVHDFAKLLDRASVEGIPLVREEKDVYRSMSIDSGVLWSWPWIEIYVLFVAPLFVLGIFFPRITALLFGLVSGALGLTFVSFWVVSTYDFFHGNWNILTFPPTHFLLAYAALRRSIWNNPERRRLIARYLAAHAAVLLLLLLARATGAIDQALGPALGMALPLALLLAFQVRWSNRAR